MRGSTGLNRGGVIVFAALAAGLAVVSGGSVAAAQSQSREQRFEFNIPSTEVDVALMTLARQTGRSLIIPSDGVAGERSKALNGTYTLREALSVMLEGANLTGDLTESGVIAISLHQASMDSREGEMASGKIKRSFLASVSTFLLGAGGAAAQGGGADEAAPSRDVIIVTATKRATDIQDTPMSITAIGSEEIKRRNLFGMDDYLAGVPGVGFTSQGPGFNNIVIRGVSVNPEKDGETSGPVTGVYFGETPISGFGHQGGSADIKLVDMERVEVLRGPQGTLYGAGAMGGVVRNIPVSPDLSDYMARVEVGYSNTAGYGDDNTSVEAVVNVPVVEDTAAVRGVFYRTSDSGYYRNVSATDPGLQDFIDNQGAVGTINNDIGAVDYIGGRVSALWQATENLSFELTYVTQEIEQDGWGQADFALGDGYEQSRPLLRRGSTLDNATTPQFEAGLSDNIELAQAVVSYDFGWGEATSSTSWVDEESELLRYIAFSGSPFAQSITFAGESFVEELRFASDFAGPLNFVIGGFYEDRKFGDTFSTVFNGDNALIPMGLGFQYSTLRRTRPSEHLALFGEVDFDVTDWLTLNGGVRWFDQERTVTQFLTINGAAPTNSEFTASESDTLFKAGLDVKPSEDLLLYASWSQGFRLGDVRAPNTVPACDADLDGFYDEYPNVPTTASPIESDKLDNYEIGAKFSGADGKFIANATAYHIDWDGIPISALQPCGISVVLNAGQAESQGLEFETSYSFDGGLFLGATASYTDATLTGDFQGLGNDGDRLPGIPKFTFSFNGGYDFVVAGYDAYVSANYTRVGGFYNTLGETGTEAGDYGRLDFDAGLDLGDATLSIFADNVTNEGEITSVYVTLGGLSGTRLRPRTIGVKLGYTF